MSDFIIPPKNKKTFQDIYFEQLTRVLEITKSEFTGGYNRQVMSGSAVITEYVSDKKEEFCQVVEALASLTHGYWKKDKFMVNEDEKNLGAYTKYLKTIDEAYKLHYDSDGIEKSREDYKKYSIKRLRATQELFMALCDYAQMKNQYASTLFTDSDEVDIDEDVRDRDEDDG